MRITYLNLTNESLACRSGAKGTVQCLVLTPSVAITADLPKTCRKMELLPHSTYSESKEWVIQSKGVLVEVSMALLEAISVPDNCPWRIYTSMITSKHHKVTIFPKRNLGSFLSDIPDGVPLSSLMLPGTHDTMAFYGWPISQCQSLSTPLSFQLRSGIRVIDIRLAIIKSRLIAYHGIYPQRTTFQEILTDVHAFLTAPSSRRETIVMSIKQEDSAVTPTWEFSRLVHKEIFAGAGGRDMWFLENKIPILGDVRGKVILLSRFGGNGDEWEGGVEGLGIHPTTWPDSEKHGFSWQCKNTLVRTHDWYNIPSFLSIPEKVQLATQLLLPPPNDPPMPTLSITFTSAASFPLAFPSTIARGFGWPQLGLGVEGVNSRFTKWLLDLLSRQENVSQVTGLSEKGWKEPRIRGWALMDFFADPGIAPLLVECNFRGRRSGEEGW